MTVHILARAALILSLLLAVCGTADAKRYIVTPTHPIGSLDFPDGWTVAEIETGIEVRSPDQELFLWIEISDSKDFDQIIAEGDDYFTKLGVLVTGEPIIDTTTQNGRTTVLVEYKATHNGAPTVLKFVITEADAGGQNLILFSYWATPAAERRYDRTIGRIFDSFRPL